MNSNRFFIPAITVLAISCLFAYYYRILRCTDSFQFEKSFGDFEVVAIEDAVGPESFAFDPLGHGPYTGVSDGRILKWQPSSERWIQFATTSSDRNGCGGASAHHDEMEHLCGRPLGLRFCQSTGNLYIADAYKGLLVVGHNGGKATSLITHVEGIPLGFTNSLDMDQRTGVVYFSDSSSQYQRRNYFSSILSGDRTGRLIKYNPQTQQVSVLLRNLAFANGVVLSENSEYILLVETVKCRVLRYWLETSKAGRVEVFAELPGFADNIKRSPRGGYWIGIYSRRTRIFQWLLSSFWMRNALLKIPVKLTMHCYSLLAKLTGNRGFAIRISERGDAVEILEDPNMKWNSISEVEERNGTVWVGSVNMPFAVKYKIQ